MTDGHGERRGFVALRELVYRLVCISLNDAKRTLVESRPWRRLRLHQFGSLVLSVQPLSTCKGSDSEIREFICAGTGGESKPPRLQEVRGPSVRPALREAPRRR